MRSLTTVVSAVLIIAGTALAMPVAGQTTYGDVHAAEGFALPRDHQYERYNPDSASYGKVDVHQVPTLIQQKAWIYDRTGQQWVYRPAQGLNPMYSATATASARAAGGWQRIHGRVQSVQGTSMRFRADDGRILSVDLSPVSPQIRRELTHGEGATVIGHRSTGANQLRAEYVQQDSSDPARGGRATGRARPPARVNAPAATGPGPHRIDGQVTSIGGSMMDLRTDDGRTLVVDMGQLNPATVKSLNGGERVTVTGLFRDSTRLDAQSVQKYNSDGSPQPPQR
jgi:hypothetical protein